jgi:hypothetical protein
MNLARKRSARATAERHRAKNDGDAAKPDAERRQAPPTSHRKAATAVSKMRWTCGQHPQNSEFKAKSQSPHRDGLDYVRTVTMNENFESRSKDQN